MVSFFIWRKLDDVPVIVSLPLNSINKRDYFNFHGELTSWHRTQFPRPILRMAEADHPISIIKLSWRANIWQELSTFTMSLQIPASSRSICTFSCRINNSRRGLGREDSSVSRESITRQLLRRLLVMFLYATESKLRSSTVSRAS